MKKFLIFIWEVGKIVVVALAIVIPIRYYLFQPFVVQGQSMQPNFQSGDYLFIDELSYRLREPQRGEVIVFRYPENPSQRFIKRVIGLPGETIEIKNGKITVFHGDKVQVLDETKYLPSSIVTAGNERVTLGNNEYFVLGDNREFSYDSRRFGVVPQANIIGRVFLRAWPFASFSKIQAPAY